MVGHFILNFLSSVSIVREGLCNTITRWLACNHNEKAWNLKSLIHHQIDPLKDDHQLISFETYNKFDIL